MRGVTPNERRSRRAPAANTARVETVQSAADGDPARRSSLLSDEYVLTVEDADLVDFLLGDQNFSYSTKDGALSWGAFGKTFHTLGELRAIAREHPAPEEGDTVGIELFRNMLDMIAFLRVRLRALADACIDGGVITGPDLLKKYSEYHDRSFEALRDQMLLRPDVFEKRFGEWLATERDYERRLGGSGS